MTRSKTWRTKFVIEQAGNVLLQVETKVLMGRLIHRCAPTRPGRE
ncbi:hypothetical protein [Pseudomonas aeruginosa]|nr:hypothetical protein [Pseudomonas aeruginosa]